MKAIYRPSPHRNHTRTPNFSSPQQLCAIQQSGGLPRVLKSAHQVILRTDMRFSVQSSKCGWVLPQVQSSHAAWLHGTQRRSLVLPMNSPLDTSTPREEGHLFLAASIRTYCYAHCYCSSVGKEHTRRTTFTVWHFLRNHQLVTHSNSTIDYEKKRP